MIVPEGLVERAVCGEHEALAALVAAVQADVWRLMLSRLGNVADAEDATQETFRQAVASIRDLREPRAFAGWLYRIALDKARETRRERASQEKTAAALAAQASACGDAGMNEVETAETRQRVRAAVKALDQDLRETVELRYDHDLSYEEIAAAMEVPAGTVARRLHTAHERLQRALAGAGIAIAIAALERELAAAPRAEMPPDVAQRTARRALEPRPAAGGSAGGSVRRSAPARPVAAGVALVVLLGIAIPVGLWLRNDGRGSAGESATGVPGSGSVSAAGGVEAGRTSGSDSRALRDENAAPRPGLARLEGRVLAAEGGPAVPGARVRLVAILRDRPVVAAEARSDAGGSWALEAGEGDYVLRVEAPGYLALEFEREYRRLLKGGRPEAADPTAGLVTLAAGKTTRRDVILASTLAPSVRLTGVVLDDRALPVADARVRIVTQSELVRPDGDEVAIVWPYGETSGGALVTDLQGRFEFPSVYGSGTVAIEASREGLAPARLTARLSGADASVTIVLARPASGRGLVVDDWGAPVHDAVLFVGVPDAEGSPKLRALRGRTDAVGAFQLEDAAAGSVVAAFAPGHGWTLRAFDPAEPLRLELPGALATLRGHVRDEAGRPVAGVTIRVTGYRGKVGELAGNLAFADPRGQGSIASSGEFRGDLPGDLRPAPVTTGDDGRFEIPAQPLGRGLRVSFEVERNGRPLMTKTTDSDAWLDIVVK